MPDQTRYNKPINQLLKVSELALSESFKTARGFAVKGNIPPSTGYRIVEAMESRKFITRDSSGSFVRGSEMLKVALSAWGLGALSLPCEPVLHQLHEETDSTAFLGIRTDSKLLVGPISPGNGADHVVPPLNAVFEGLFDDDGTGLVVGALTEDKAISDISETTYYTMYSSICDGLSQSQAVIGVLLTRPPSTNRNRLVDCVLASSSRLKESVSEPDSSDQV